MFFDSVGKKAMLASAENVLSSFKQSSIEHNSPNSNSIAIDRDAVIMFVGWLHFSIAYMLSANKLKPNEIMSVLTKAALSVRSIAPNHELGDAYLQKSGEIVKSAMDLSNIKQQAKKIEEYDYFLWTDYYYEDVSPSLNIDRAVFIGCICREALAVMS